MIELISESRCTACDRCVDVCPTNVFDTVKGGIPVIARPDACQTCLMCGLYCPVDARYMCTRSRTNTLLLMRRNLPGKEHSAPTADHLAGSWR
ncbi:4Fe-4S dicluster domain-containing protein [Paraburkholderia graminis]|uniref:4Fe-4S dicluster domain-containing protein n=2 Tax=Paraburkholderia graminis TaxID=60548 RepID=UPI0027D779B5|nr:ferredoxin family protein [Paraburkholderia graminis]